MRDRAPANGNTLGPSRVDLLHLCLINHHFNELAAHSVFSIYSQHTPVHLKARSGTMDLVAAYSSDPSSSAKHVEMADDSFLSDEACHVEWARRGELSAEPRIRCIASHSCRSYTHAQQAVADALALARRLYRAASTGAQPSHPTAAGVSRGRAHLCSRLAYMARASAGRFGVALAIRATPCGRVGAAA